MRNEIVEHVSRIAKKLKVSDVALALALMLTASMLVR
jgi:hypothetical protein